MAPRQETASCLCPSCPAPPGGLAEGVSLPAPGLLLLSSLLRRLALPVLSRWAEGLGQSGDTEAVRLGAPPSCRLPGLRAPRSLWEALGVAGF